SRNGSGSENGSGSDSGSDSEDVDMAEFKRHTDPGVEWLGCKENVLEENEVFELEEVDHEEFDSGSDSDEGVRRKALRKVARMNKAIQGKGERVYKEDFFLGEQFATSKLVKDKVTRVSVEQRRKLSLTKNDKLRCYPLAYAVVESESKDSWKWFLDCLGDDLELFRNSNFTCISDRQKGVIPAIAENFPNAEHRFCLKHIYDNMKLSWRGKFYKEMLWKCATASTIQKFDKRMEEMKNHNLEAYEWLRKIPPQHWASSKQAASRWNGQAGVTSHGDAAHGSQQAGVAGHGDVAHGSQQA
ncbi:mutator type transposase, partial [Tanacetum coccineum]